MKILPFCPNRILYQCLYKQIVKDFWKTLFRMFSFRGLGFTLWVQSVPLYMCWGSLASLSGYRAPHCMC